MFRLQFSILFSIIFLKGALDPCTKFHGFCLIAGTGKMPTTARPGSRAGAGVQGGMIFPTVLMVTSCSIYIFCLHHTVCVNSDHLREIDKHK